MKSRTLNPIFDQYPKEGAAIGALLLAYSELEVNLMHVVIRSGSDFDEPFKALYRVRGESQRISVADGLARHKLSTLNANLGNQFAIAVGALHHCRQIRNQYAHCQWYADASGYIKFANLEEDAKSNTKFSNFESLNIRRVNLGLLQRQREYFDYVHCLLDWIVYETYRLKGIDMSNYLVDELPKPLDKPPLYIA